VSAPSSVLELLLPDGHASAIAVLGSGCPPLLGPPSPSVEPPWDLVVVAPCEGESRSRSWVDATARAAARSVSDDGLVYVLAPMATRLRLGKILRQAGLATSGMLHLRYKGTSQVLLVLDHRALCETAQRLVAPGLGRTGLRLAAALGAARWLRCHPSATLLARRPGARPMVEWLAAACTEPLGDRLVAIRLRRNARRERAVLHLRGAVAKVVLSPVAARREIRSEAETLAALAPAARSTGVEVPSCRIVEAAPGCDVLVQEILEGTPAVWTLSRVSSALEPLIVRLSGWLQRWGTTTRVLSRVGADFFRHIVLEPAVALVDCLPDGAGYVGWLETRCRVLEGTEFPLVATHGDLTMSNILLGSDGRLGIVDWEEAEPRGLPLSDLYYAVVDAAAAHGKYRDRAGAFQACFRREGPILTAVRMAGQRLARALEVSDEVATIAFHACWLRHATNERRKRAAGQPTPFLLHLQDVARQRDVIRVQGAAGGGQELNAAS